ncbi:CMF_HP2_G0007360.mRNA.1.CDS.1 [Saccharomyces cerevisiae]|nr:CMF_HP2_G0007360.mRNA.1.CDS.1 [Saccharomyces cerevisiae]CAI6417117.1 CMF_HP2_G0007360.mRNA.1.CDS.1 [Saccharomyces cerevisiae]CAI6419266.1 CMF_HP1_G0007620.mRNA.1.CDS.1 [Saccharomyces cerevisiae]CAI7190973.1 CMF_collapsed_G0008510.mRNA.1.CDS.1 [Saccharomyces cerevisiae]
MSRDAPIKADKDYSQILKEEFPKIDSLAQNDCNSALDQLLVLEKKTRQASDLASSKEVLAKIVDLLASRNKWDDLNEQLTLLSKKHGQLKLSIQYMIQKVMEYLKSSKSLDLNTRISVIETIRVVTENKIFVEVERARVTKDLVEIKKEEGKIDEAADILCELQVETYGSMEMSEKIQFILEQMELSILKGDYSQATVLSRKILKKTFKNPKYESLKLEYYNLLVKISLHKREYLEVAQYLQEIYQTDAIKSDEAKWKLVLSHIVYFLVLSPYGNLQNDLIHKIQNDNNLKKLESQESLVKLFTTNELMRWPIVQKTYEPVLNEDDLAFGGEANKHHWEDLQKRVIEHNLRVISEYYSRITLLRLNELLDLTESQTETYISDLVNQGIIYAKVNRPAKIVNFEKPKNSSQLLNEWSHNVDELLEHIETIGHLITKEEIMHGLQAK